VPDLDFASGLLSGFQKKVNDERARKDQNNQFIVSTLINSGRVKDINDLAPFLGDLGSKTGSGGGKGKSGGAGGKQDPMGIIGMLVNPIFKKHAEKVQAAGQPGGSDGQTQPQQPPQGAQIGGRSVGMFSEDEMQQRADAVRQQQLKEQTQSKIDVEKAKPQPRRFSAGTVKGDQLPQGSTDIYGKPVDPKASYAQGTDTDGTTPIYVPREASAGQQARDAKAQDLSTFTGYANAQIADAEQSAGHPLSKAEKVALIDKARAKWSSDAQIPFAQKLQLAREYAKVRQEIGAPSEASVMGSAQQIKIAGVDRPFVNLDEFTGEKSRNAAREDALKNGVIPVTKSQADQLAATNTALGNLNEFFTSLSSKMPADAKGRPLESIEIPLKQLFQTDEELAAAVSWNVSVLPQLRAMNVTGRVPVFEYQQALAAQPKLTDTVGTAKKKLAIVQGIMERGAKSILDRPYAKGVGGADVKPPAAADPAKRTRARQALLTANKQADDATIDLFLKNNPSFK